MVEIKTRASEAKGPFPGGKRVGSRGKKRKKKESKRKKKETHPAQWDGLEGIGLPPKKSTVC